MQLYNFLKKYKVGERGVTVGIDINPDVVDLSIENIKKDQLNLIETGCIKMRGKIKLIMFFL